MSESALHFSQAAASQIAAERTLSDQRMTPPPAANDESSELNGAEDRSQAREGLQATLRRAVAGDQAAWREVVEIYSGRVFGLIRAQCNNTDLAEEITQSTFCTIVAKIGSYTELGKFEQWLFRIAMNRLRDEMRRRKRQARSMEDDTLSGLVGKADDAASDALSARGMQDPAELAALRAALAQLPDADQQILHLRHHGELSFKQIAQILDQPLGTVLARQHRALKKLAEILKGRFGDTE